MPKPNYHKLLTIQTLAFRTTMSAARFRQLIEGAVATDPLLNESFIVGEVELQMGSGYHLVA